MLVAARVEPLPNTRQDRRSVPRMQLSLGAVVGELGSSARIHDLSTKGLLFETSAELSDELVQVQLPDSDPVQARVAWRHGRFFGCEFVEPIGPASVSAARLRSDPAPDLGPALASAASGPTALRWAKPAIAAALTVAGAAYLVAAGKLLLLAAIAVAVAALACTLMLLVAWGLDHTPDLKL